MSPALEFNAEIAASLAAYQSRILWARRELMETKAATAKTVAQSRALMNDVDILLARSGAARID
jgi:hypothetical protein